ncbi:MAG: two-component system sensor histidine kinase NtrB [Vicinamibacterales bacterium]
MPRRKRSNGAPRGRQTTPARGRGRSGSATGVPAVRDGFFRDMVRGLQNGVLAVTADGRIAVMNDIACRILAIEDRPADIGRPFVSVLRSQPDVVRILASAFELSHLPNRAELRLKSSGRVIGYTLSPIRDPRGRRIGATLFFKDLTRVEQLEERERLRDRLMALGEMAAAIAHEVKNPLAGIEVMAGVLKRQLASSADAQTILIDIINEAKMANAIVQDVLEFVRPIRLEVERVSLHDVVHDAITMAESHVPRGGTEVALALPPDLPRIQGDPHQLRQVVTNLLTNAFEALGGRGRVDIKAVETVDDHGDGPLPMIILEVVDDGPGVTLEVKERMFGPFFTTKPQGTGLGLAIVRKIIDAHDGRIDVESRPGSGARFRVTLPITGSHPLFGTV